jgi:hypothetical protein
MAQASSNGAMLVYNFLPVHRIVYFARLCFVDRENIHQILHICIAQSFQISKTDFTRASACSSVMGSAPASVCAA